MKLLFAPRAVKQYRELPPDLRAIVDKQLEALLSNLRHPSLRAKKYDEIRDIWQGRVTRDCRFYFRIEGDTYHILSITKHPK